MINIKTIKLKTASLLKRTLKWKDFLMNCTWSGPLHFTPKKEPSRLDKGEKQYTTNR